MAKSPSVRLLLVRAGSTEWDDAGRLQGNTDLPLSPSGRDAVRVEAERLRDDEIVAVHCGSDEGSIQTAQALADATGARVRRHDELCEMNLGLWEGLLNSQLEERYPRAGRHWTEDPGSVNAPEGEALTEARERVVSAVTRLLDKSRNGGAVAVVLRPIALGIVRCWLNEEPTRGLWSLVKDRPSLEWYDVPRDRLRVPAASGAS